MNDNKSYPHTQTFLIEASRGDSLIDNKDNNDFNSKWTTETNLVLKRGDTVSCEMVSLNAQNAGSSASIEFSGENVIIDGVKKDYCDNKILLEVFFYLNNNNTYSVGLPLKHPHGSFDDTTYAQQRYQPRTGGNNGAPGSGLVSNNVRGIIGTPNTISYGTLDVTSNLSVTLTGSKAHYIVAWQKTDNTWVTTLPSATKIKAFVLGSLVDNTAGFNPLSGRSCTHTDWLRGKSGVGSLCNLLEGQELVTQDDGGILIPDQNRIILGIIKQPLAIPTLTGTDRLQISVNPETFWTSVQPCSQGAFFAALPYTDNYGTSEIGLINYDNLNPLSYVTQPQMAAKNSNLSNYMQNIGRHFLPATPAYQVFANALYGDAAKPQEISVAQSVYDPVNTQTGDPGFRCQNPRMENNSKPYILTRNDWCGQGRRQQNDCRKFLPKLEPLSAFILLEADELFTDVNSLAQKINDKLHETLNLFNTDIQEQDNYLSNQIQYENITAKASSVLPLAQTAGYIDPALGTGVTENYAFYDTIIPIKCGGCVKIQPANFDDGINYYASGSVANVDKLTEYFSKTTYINKCPIMSVNPEKIENPIYGNCGYLDFFKQQMGDRWARLPIKDMNTVASRGILAEGGLRYMSKVCILNNKLKYATVNVESTAVVSTVATELMKNQLIFTNIYYPTINVDKTQQATEEQKWIDYAKEVRKYELYSNNTESALRDYDLQNQSIDWIIDMDLGITDDNKTAFLKNAPVGTSRFEPIQFDWTTQYPAIADSTADVNGTSADIAGASRPLINPIFSNPAFGTTNIFDYNLQYAQYRPLGRILLESRYDINYFTTSKTVTDQLPAVIDSICELLDSSDKNISPTQPLNNVLIETLNLGIYPYEYTDEDGNKTVLCAIRTGKKYEPTLAEGGDFLELQLAALTWGLPIGVSPASLDNHMICPMNADFRKTTLAAPNRALLYNRVNQIWVGANNPTFQFNSDKNRYEFINLQTDQLLSSFNAVSGAAPTTATPAVPSQLGQKVGIIGRDPLDAKFSSGGKKAKIKGIRDALGGVGIYNVWLCPPDYIPPSTISLSNYWDNSTTTKTQENHDIITANCIEASRDNWEGSLLDRCGFDYFSLFPKYGRQYNRFDPVTYNNDNPRLIGTGTKPLLLGNRLNNVNNPSLSLYYSPVTPAATDPVLGQPNFGLSFPNGQPVLIENDSQQLTATSSPILTTSPFYIIYSDIVGERNYQSGSTPLPALFYCMRNYSNSGFFYGYGSTFSIMINQDRVLSLINTEIRNPNGELAKLSKNSTIMYKIQRQATMPAPTIDVFGQIENQQQPDPNQEELLEILKETSSIASSIAGGSGTRIKKSGSNAAANIIRVPSRGVATNAAIPSSVAGTQTQGVQLSSGSSQTQGVSSSSGGTQTIGEQKTNSPQDIATGTQTDPLSLEDALSQTDTFTQADALSQTDIAQGIEQMEISIQAGSDSITPQTLGISDLDRKLVDVILRSILAKLPARWRKTAAEQPEMLGVFGEDPEDWFPVSSRKTGKINKNFLKAIRQVFDKINLDQLLLTAQNNPDALVESLTQTADPATGRLAGILTGLKINTNGQVTYNLQTEDPIANQNASFIFNAMETNNSPSFQKLIDQIILSQGRNFTKRQLKDMSISIRNALIDNEIIGEYTDGEGQRFVYEQLDNFEDGGGGYGVEGIAPTAIPIVDEMEFIPTVQQSVDQLGELNFIFTSQDGTALPLDQILVGLNESIVPRTNAPRQQELTPEQMMAAREAQNNPDTGEQQGEVKSNTPDELSSSFANTSLARDPDQGTDPQGKPPDDKKK